jgi:site-specific recombinase XerD
MLLTQGVYMKEEIKDTIVAGMIPYLDNAQLKKLQLVIEQAFVGLSIVSQDSIDAQEDKEKVIRSFISAKRIEGCSEKTLSYYSQTINMTVNEIGKVPQRILTEDLREYLTDYQSKRKTSKVTIDNIRRILSSFFSWLEDEDYIVKSPVRRIHKVKTNKVIKDTYSDETLELMRDHCGNLRDLALIDILASSGIRVGELVNLNRDDVDFNEREFVVFGKGSKERQVYFDARTKVHLQNYLNGRKDENNALFVSLKAPYNRLSIGGVESRLHGLGERLSIKKVHPHKFRRTMATTAIDKGMPIEQVQQLLGHQKIDTTLHYAMVKQSNVKMAHRKFIG